MDYILAGMVSMLQTGLATPEMEFADLESVCDEPELREYDDIDEMLSLWEAAKTQYLSAA